MTISKVKETFKSIVEMYFAGATVIWGDGNQTKTTKPYIWLKLRPSSSTTHSIKVMENEELCGYKPSQARIELNLITEGEKIDVGDGFFPIYDNTAVSDLEEFLSFLDSEEIILLCEKHDIEILNGEVTDVTALLEGIENEYRAMCEFTINYTKKTKGAYGIAFKIKDKDPDKPFVPTASGGGTKELASKEIGYFEKVNIESEE